MRVFSAACFFLLASVLITAMPALADRGSVASPADYAATSPKKAGGQQPPPDGTPAIVVDDNEVESLLGRVVTSEAGEKYGPITDILVGHSGDVRAAVIDFGGFLGVGTRKVAVAWSALRFSAGAIALNMT